MRLRQTIFPALALSMLALLAGCGSSSKTTPPPPPTIVISANSGYTNSATVGGSFGTLAATVTSNGSPASGVSVTFTAPTSGASGTFATSTPAATDTETTNSSGIATSQAFTANTTAGAFVVTATTSGATSGANFSLTNTASTGLTTLPDGTYVYSLAGQNSASSFVYYVAGAFTIASGTITNGEQDYVDYTAGTLSDTITGGSATIINGMLTVTINVSGDTYVGVNGVETLAGTMVSSTGSRALIIEYDTSATSSGELDLQVQPSSTPLQGYAFYLNGVDASEFGANIGGVVNVDGAGTISGAGSVFDIDDSGTVAQKQPIDSGTVSTADQFGRFTVSLVLTTSGYGGLGLVGYVVDSNRVRLVENENDPNDFNGFFGVTGGTAFAQGSGTGTYTVASAEGNSYVFGGVGLDGSGYFQIAGVVTMNNDGSTISGTLNANDLTGTGVQLPEPFTGNYTVDSTGRVTLSNILTGATIQVYLNASSTLPLAAMDGTDQWAGLARLQTGAGSFAAGSFSGSYGFGAQGYGAPSGLVGPEFDATGPVTADGVSAIAGTASQNIWDGTPTPGLPVTGTFTAAASGIFSDGLTGLDITTSTNSDAFTYYVVDTTRVVAIETDANQLTLGYFELVQ